MKTLISITCLVILSTSGYLLLSANAELDKSILIPYADNDLVVIGKIIQVDTVVSENKTEYIIDVEKYLKNPKTFDMITAFVEGIQTTDFSYSNPIDYYNKPFFEKENQVFVYLKNENGKYKISPYSFALEKNEPKGPPPDVIWPTEPMEFQFNQGEEIVISGLVKKAYLYQLEQRGESSSVNLKIFDKNNELLVSEKLNIRIDGTYEYPFQIKGKPVIPGKYSYEIQFGSTTLNDEFIIEINPNLWSPLKQFMSGIPVEEIKCKENLALVIKVSNGNPACVKPETKQKLIERGWAKNQESNGITVTIGEDQREGPLLVQKIFSDSIQGLNFPEYPVATNVGYPITLHIGDKASNGCTVELTLVKINNNTATFLKKEYQNRPCPICLSENTEIYTPNGPINVEKLKEGMTVWTQDHYGNKQTATILKTGKTLVFSDHKMIHVVLDDKRELYVSPNHPTADGRLFGELSVGEILNDSKIRSVEQISYNGTYTYDILPSGQTGFYWANGILVKSTLTP